MIVGYVIVAAPGRYVNVDTWPAKDSVFAATIFRTVVEAEAHLRYRADPRMAPAWVTRTTYTVTPLHILPGDTAPAEPAPARELGERKIDLTL